MWFLFEGRTKSSMTMPALSKKLPKCHFFNPCIKFEFFFSQIISFKWYEWLYPKYVSSSVQGQNKWIKMDELDYLQKVLTTFENYFIFRFLWTSRKTGKAKIESAYSSMLKYSKITVWRIKLDWERWQDWIHVSQ